jgi:type I restriction enzyme S subunit
VYCLRGATLGKTAIVDYSEGAIASSLVIIRLSDAVFRKYAYYYLISPLGKSLVKRFDNGSAQPNLAATSVQKYVFPLPPLAEQHRIVARVEQLRRLCAELRGRLQQARVTQSRLADALVSAADQSPSC